MTLQKIAFNFMVERGGKLAKSLLTSKPLQKINFEGLKYVPSTQLSSDVVEVSKRLHSYEDVITKETLERLCAAGKNKREMTEELHITMPCLRKYLKKFGLFKDTKVRNSSNKTIKKQNLQKLRDEGMSMSEIASKLKVPFGKVRYNIEKHNITRNISDEAKVLKDYFFAATPETKAKAFSEVDKYLEKIAQDEFKLRKGTSFEDCLQDVRLRFLELVNKNKGNNIDVKCRILQTMREAKPKLQPEIKTVSLETIENNQRHISTTDRGIDVFEDNDYGIQLWDYLHKYLIRERDYVMLKQYIQNDKSVKEIAEYFNLTTKRTKKILDEALPKLETAFKNIPSDEYISQRVKFSHNVAEQAAARDLARGDQTFA